MGGEVRLLVTAWLQGGPAHGESRDLSTPLPSSITLPDGAEYVRIGPELDEGGQSLSTWCYRWKDDLALDAPREP